MDVEEVMERAKSVDTQWWSSCAELAMHCITTLQSEPVR